METGCFLKMFALMTVIGAISAAITPSPVVRTKKGQVQGKLVQLPTARQDVYEFTGIPFAEPPIGKLRFKKPVSKANWTGILDATKPTNCCIQVISGGVDPYGDVSKYLMVPGVQMSEDCLYLNVWAPRNTLEAAVSARARTMKKLPVYVVIHGGGFVTGATMTQLYNGTMLSGFDNIIVVTIQYRLGSLGFAYFGKNTDVPGNAGLWDQNEALKWVSENIDAFGGNSSEVTLGGESAGAASVAYHLLSNYTRKYFQRAIIESGSAIAPWASHTPEDAAAITSIVLNQTATTAKCRLTRRSNVTDKINCLRQADAISIAIADGIPMAMGYASGSVPTVDGDFIPRNPGEMLGTGDFYKIPTMMGANKDEGSMLFLGNTKSREFLPNPGNPNASVEALGFDQYNKLISIAFEISSISPMPVGQSLFSAIQLHYWPTTHQGFPRGMEVVNAASYALGDYSLTCPTYTWATVASPSLVTPANKSALYVYYFTQPPPKGMLPVWVGPFHGEELIYVFGLPFAPFASQITSFSFSEDERTLSKLMMEYWGNFIKYGDPNIRDPQNLGINNYLRNWPPYNGTDCPYQVNELSVQAQFKGFDSVGCGTKARDCLFWSDLFPKLIDFEFGSSATTTPAPMESIRAAGSRSLGVGTDDNADDGNYN